MIVTLLTIAAASLALVFPAPAAGQGAANSGPILLKWELSAKDTTGLVWSGTLTIAKLDPIRFDAKKYHSLCILEMESTDPTKGTKGAEEPCEWEPATRKVTFGNTYPAVYVFTAILSADGKVLTQGKWTEATIKRGTGGGVIRSGEWSAKLSNR
jgi:hypothetical protein